MFKTKLSFYKLGTLATAGLLVAMSPEAANAANNFSALSTNITDSLSDVPGLLSAIAYLFGIILVILGIIKIKEHVEKPDQTPLKEGFIRLVIGGALFALPLLLDIAKKSVSGNLLVADVSAGAVKKVTMNVN